MKKNIIIGSIVIILLLATTIIIYQSKALYKTTDQHNFINSKADFFVSKDFSYTGSSQEFIVPQSGYYQIELWGASGNMVSVYVGGLGSYTKGTIKLNKGEKIYFYVGNKSSVITAASYNGGGESSATTGASGGGATDVRLISGSWSDSTSLRSRIMVAAGGGGGGARGQGYGGGTGASGGTLLGLNGNVDPGSVTVSYGQYPGGMGTQTTGGQTLAINNTSGVLTYQNPIYWGKFGKAGPTYLQSGGGSGYYGGANGAHGGGGSGSSYISGYAGVNSVLENGGTIEQPLHSNNTIHYSNKYFVDGEMQAGINFGNGKAKITYLNNPPIRINAKLNNVRYIKSCVNGNSVNSSNHWTELQAIKDGKNLALGKNVTATTTVNPSWNPFSAFVDGDLTASFYTGTSIGGLQCLTVDLGSIYDLDEIGLWNYWADGRTYYQNTLSVGATNVVGTTSLSTVLHTYTGVSGYQESSLGRRYTAWD